MIQRDSWKEAACVSTFQKESMANNNKSVLYFLKLCEIQKVVNLIWWVTILTLVYMRIFSVMIMVLAFLKPFHEAYILEREQIFRTL